MHRNIDRRRLMKTAGGSNANVEISSRRSMAEREISPVMFNSPMVTEAKRSARQRAYFGRDPRLWLCEIGTLIEARSSNIRFGSCAAPP